MPVILGSTEEYESIDLSVNTVQDRLEAEMGNQKNNIR